MTAKSTKDLQVCITKALSTPTPLVPTAITQAKPAVVTVAATTAATGDLVTMSGTDLPSLDGKTFTAGTTSGTTIELLGSDTTGDPAFGTPASPVATLYDDDDLECICFSSITLNVDEPGTISVATFCDPSATIASAVSTAGTMSFAGFVDILDSAYSELLLAESDGLERIMRIELPSNGYLVAPMTFTSISWDLPVDGAIGYTGTTILTTQMQHQF